MAFDVGTSIEEIGLQGLPSATLQSVAGDTLFYNSGPFVSSTVNAGSLSAGQSLTMTAPTWIVSKSRTTINVSYPTGSDVTTDNLSLISQTKAPRGRVFNPESFGAKADLIAFYDGAMTAGSTTITSASFTTSSLPSGAGSKNIYIAWAGAGTAAGTTSAGVSTGAPITSIPRTAGAAIPAGPVLITSGANAQLFNTSGATLNGAVPVVSSTPIFSFPSGSTLTFNNAGLSTTVQTVGAGTATLAVAATSTVQNMVGWYGTDDTAAVLGMRAAIGTQGGTELWNNAGYLLDGPPIATGNGWATIPFPLVTQGSFTMLGSAGVGSASAGLSGTNSDLSGTVIATTRQGDVYSASHGAPSMMGGPTFEGTGNTSQLSLIAMVRMEDVTFLRPENPAIGGVDCSLAARTEHRRCFCKTAGQINRAAYNFTATPASGYGAMGQVPSNVWNFGFWMPDVFNFTDTVAASCGAVGDYCGFVVSAHTVLDNCFAQFCTQALGVRADLNGAITGEHLNRLTRFGIFDCPQWIGGWDPVHGVTSLSATTPTATFVGDVALELAGVQWTAATAPFTDANGRIRGRLTCHAYSIGALRVTPSSSGLVIVDADAAGLSPTSYDDLVLAESGLLAYIKLNEPTGTSAQDSSGNAHTGTHAGTPILGLSGPLGNADASVKYTSAGQWTTLDTLGTLGANLATTTVEFWVRATSATVGFIMGTAGTASAAGLDVEANFPSAGQTSFIINDNATLKRAGHITTAIYDGNWHHVVWLVSTTGTHVVYVDGVPQTVTMDNTATLGAMGNFSQTMALGAQNVNTLGPLVLYPCRLAKVAYYMTTQLTASRIQQHYQAALRTR